MNKIKISEIEQEQVKLELLINGRRITKHIQEELRYYGYELIQLGTGKEAYSTSGQIDIWKLDNKYAKGKYFGVGVSNAYEQNLTSKKSRVYKAFVKELI